MSDPRPADNRTDRSNAWLFAAICVLVLGAVVAYGVYSRRKSAAAQTAGSSPPIAAADAATLASARQRPHLLFRITELGPQYGRVGLVPLDAPANVPLVTPLTCDRVYASAAHGLCLQADRGVLTTYRAVAFDSAFSEKHRFTLPGAPSRTRVAAEAPLGASTVFVSGDSYSAGGFSTRTTLYDLAGNTALGDLETYRVIREGQPFKRPDFNFWGVTFAPDGDTFYATLGTGGTINFMKGSIARREMTLIGSDVECPSLSPDGTRVAYKARLVEGGRVIWRIRVRDLASGAITTTSETRSVDDQVEWLNEREILYALPQSTTGSGSSDVWAVPADGSGEPRVFVTNAFSPAVIRVGNALP
jgi:hypothetical protein